jgi:hypothetical protein
MFAWQNVLHLYSHSTRPAQTFRLNNAKERMKGLTLLTRTFHPLPGHSLTGARP